MRAPACVALVVFLCVWTLTTRGKYSASGDEPHYLIVTHSLVTDGDLDVGGNYAANDGRHLGHDGLARGLHAVETPRGPLRSIHGVGLPVLVAPSYLLGRLAAHLPSDALLARMKMSRGLLTYAVVSLSLAALTALATGLLTASLMPRLAPPVAAAVGLVAGLSPPVVSHAFLVFPDVVAYALVCAVVWLTRRPDRRDDHAALLAVVAALGWLPWLHHKFALYVPGLLAVIAWTRWTTLRAWSRPLWTMAALLVVLPPVLLVAWSWQTWGTLGGALTTGGLPFAADTLLRGVAGLWIDRRSGLLAFAPIYGLVPLCWVLTGRTSWPWLLPAVLLVVPAASFTLGWWGGFSPAARYLLPLTPCFVAIIADALQVRVVRALALVLVVPQLAIDVAAWREPRALWPAASGNVLLRGLGPFGRLYEQALPDLQPAAPDVTAAVTRTPGPRGLE